MPAIEVLQVDYSCTDMPGHLFPKSCCNMEPVGVLSPQLGNFLIRQAPARLFPSVAQYSDDAFAFRSFAARNVTQPSGMADSVMLLVNVA